MIVGATRFADQVQPCNSGRCETRVIMVDTGRTEMLLNAEASDDGKWLLRDTGGDRPLARQLTVAQQFGRKGQLHAQHVCGLRKAGR